MLHPNFDPELRREIQELTDRGVDVSRRGNVITFRNDQGRILHCGEVFEPDPNGDNPTQESLWSVVFIGSGRHFRNVARRIPGVTELRQTNRDSFVFKYKSKTFWARVRNVDRFAVALTSQGESFSSAWEFLFLRLPSAIELARILNEVEETPPTLCPSFSWTDWTRAILPDPEFYPGLRRDIQVLTGRGVDISMRGNVISLRNDRGRILYRAEVFDPDPHRQRWNANSLQVILRKGFGRHFRGIGRTIPKVQGLRQSKWDVFHWRYKTRSFWAYIGSNPSTREFTLRLEGSGEGFGLHREFRFQRLPSKAELEGAMSEIEAELALHSKFTQKVSLRPDDPGESEMVVDVELV
jgi:hypothetical protein